MAICPRPGGWERVGDVSDAHFASAAVVREYGEFLLYFASSDTRLQVATSPIYTLVDYLLHTPPDVLRTAKCVEQRIELIHGNHALG